MRGILLANMPGDIKDFALVLEDTSPHHLIIHLISPLQLTYSLAYLFIIPKGGVLVLKINFLIINPIQ